MPDAGNSEVLVVGSHWRRQHFLHHTSFTPKKKKKKGVQKPTQITACTCETWELISLIHPDTRVDMYYKINTSHISFWMDALFLSTLSVHFGIFPHEAAGCTIIMTKWKSNLKKRRNGVRGDEGYLSKWQVLRPILTDTALPAFRWLPWIVIFVPPENGPRDGITRVKYGDWGHTHTHVQCTSPFSDTVMLFTTFNPFRTTAYDKLLLRRKRKTQSSSVNVHHSTFKFMFLFYSLIYVSFI